jgi:hypothetical protein
MRKIFIFLCFVTISLNAVVDYKEGTNFVFPTAFISQKSNITLNDIVLSTCIPVMNKYEILLSSIPFWGYNVGVKQQLLRRNNYAISHNFNLLYSEEIFHKYDEILNYNLLFSMSNKKSCITLGVATAHIKSESHFVVSPMAAYNLAITKNVKCYVESTGLNNYLLINFCGLKIHHGKNIWGLGALISGVSRDGIIGCLPVIQYSRIFN